MGNMYPFRKYRDLGALDQLYGRLANHAAEAINNGELTERAYRPVQYDWRGLGQDQVMQAPTPLKRTAHESVNAMSWAAVVTKMWVGQMRRFNRRVDRIWQEYQRAASPVWLPVGTECPPPGIRSPGAQCGPHDNPAQVSPAEQRQAAHRNAVREYHAAYEELIVNQRWKFRSMLVQGPTVDNVDRARKAKAIPDPYGDPFGLDGVADLFKLPGDLLSWINKIVSTGLTGGDIVAAISNTAGSGALAERLERYSSFLGVGGLALGGFVAAHGQWEKDSGRRMGSGERIARAGFRGIVDAAGSFVGSAAGAASGAAAGFETGPLAIVAVPALGVAGGVVGGAAGGAAADHLADQFIDPIGRGERNLSELIRRDPALLDAPTT